MPNKKRCEQKRRIEAEKTATKCMKLDEMWGKENVKKMDENQERRDPSSCEDKQEEIPSSSPISPENVPEILLPNEEIPSPNPISPENVPEILLPNEMSTSKEDLEDELSSSSRKIQVNEPNKSHERETINVHKVFYKGYVLDIRKVQEKIGKNIISIYHEKIGQRK